MWDVTLIYRVRSRHEEAVEEQGIAFVRVGVVPKVRLREFVGLLPRHVCQVVKPDHRDAKDVIPRRIGTVCLQDETHTTSGLVHSRSVEWCVCGERHCPGCEVGDVPQPRPRRTHVEIDSTNDCSVGECQIVGREIVVADHFARDLRGGLPDGAIEGETDTRIVKLPEVLGTIYENGFLPHPVWQRVEGHVAIHERKALAACLNAEWVRRPSYSCHRQEIEIPMHGGSPWPGVPKDSVASALDNVHVPTRQQSVHSESLEGRVEGFTVVSFVDVVPSQGLNRDDSSCRDTIGYERTIDESLLMEERACLEAASAGDSAAFVRLYEKHINSVYRYALQMLRSIPEAEDIAQEVFILAWVKRTKIRIVDQSVLPWLLVTTRNLSLNRIKKANRDARNASLDAQDVSLRSHQDTEGAVMSGMLAAAIEDAIEDLSSTDQTLYYLCISEGFSYQKAADVLGVTHGVVRNRLARVRRALQLNLATRKEGLS
jgi:RNA polymerase sigma factor (sigma-70 family)